MAVTYSVCVSGDGIDSFLGFEYCGVITLASRVFRISRIRRNLFIHNGTILCKRISSSISQHFKNSPPFASRTDIPLVGFATRARERESASHCLILILLAQLEDVFISAHVFLYLFLPFILISRHIIL